MSEEKVIGPAERCACGDLFWRHGNGDDGGPCAVYSRVPTKSTFPQYEGGDTYERCDCAGFERAEDDL
jgi:hypothetical protein